MKHITFASGQENLGANRPSRLGKALSALALVSTLGFGCGRVPAGATIETDHMPSSKTASERTQSVMSKNFNGLALELSVSDLLKDMVQNEKRRKLDLYSQVGHMQVREEQFNIINKLVRAGETPQIRAAASRALAYIGDLRAVGTLVSALDDKDYSVQYAAAHALGRIGPHDAKELQAAVPALIEHMKSAEPGLCPYAYPLGKIDSSFEPLVSILEDRDSGEIPRIYAAEILGDKGAVAVIPLIDALDDPSSTVRRFAMDGLSRTHDERVVPAFRKSIARLTRISRDKNASENERNFTDREIESMNEFIRNKQ
jgi:hypothetical protein